MKLILLQHLKKQLLTRISVIDHLHHLSVFALLTQLQVPSNAVVVYCASYLWICLTIINNSKMLESWFFIFNFVSFIGHWSPVFPAVSCAASCNLLKPLLILLSGVVMVSGFPFPVWFWLVLPKKMRFFSSVLVFTVHISSPYYASSQSQLDVRSATVWGLSHRQSTICRILNKIYTANLLITFT